VLDNQSIDNLPTNGRDFTNFVLLTPSANLIPSSNVFLSAAIVREGTSRTLT
jgi:hypothetical protein